MKPEEKNIHFVGIAGSGMSALAQIHAMAGGKTTGSDRSFDRGGNAGVKKKLEKLGIRIFPQDGSGISGKTELVVLSTAIEDDNPETAPAKKLKIPVIHRSELLAEYVSAYRTIAVAGTSGKSTVAAMIFEILEKAGRSPSIITGGNLLTLEERGLSGNAYSGGSELLVIEADESDGSMVNYKPAVGVFLNLTKDHKEVGEIKDIFLRFKSHVKTFIVNSDDPNLSYLKNGGLTFGINSGDTRAVDIKLEPKGSRFKIHGENFHLPAPGAYNIENAAAAVAACLNEGVPVKDCAEALSKYKGVARRFQSIGEADGVEVIDDFAHNPAKISAALEAAHLRAGRVLAVYQPHGFAPTRHLKNELIEAFKAALGEEDMLWLPEIYYAGGTADKSISSNDIVRPIAGCGRKAFFIPDRKEIIPEIAKNAGCGDVVIVMGARDPSLGDYSRAILKALKEALYTRKITTDTKGV